MLQARITEFAQTLDQESGVGLPAIEQALDLAIGVSLLTEEGHPLQCDLTVFLDSPPAGAADSAKQRGWRFVEFAEGFPATVSSVAKLAMATDRRTGSIAITPGADGLLEVRGLVDAGPDIDAVSNYDLHAPPEMPGQLSLSIEGPMTISVFTGRRLVGMLTPTRTVVGVRDPIFNGPVGSRMVEGRDRFLAEFGEKDPFREALTEHLWHGMLCRLLHRIRGFGHGGAVLMSPPDPRGLQAKYSVKCSVVRDALGEAVTGQVDSLEGQRRIDHALWFIASMTRVDGLVHLDHDWNCLGFGAMIQGKPDGKLSVLNALDDAAKTTDEYPVALKGSRHRSMANYVKRHPAAMGFVVSQDGGVTAFLRMDDQVVAWQDLKLRDFA